MFPENLKIIKIKFFELTKIVYSHVFRSIWKRPMRKIWRQKNESILMDAVKRSILTLDAKSSITQGSDISQNSAFSLNSDTFLASRKCHYYEWAQYIKLFI